MFNYQGGKLTNKCTANCVSKKKVWRRRRPARRCPNSQKWHTRTASPATRLIYPTVKEPAVLSPRKSSFCRLHLTNNPKAESSRRCGDLVGVFADQPLSSFPGTLKWPPRWCTRAPAARRCATPTARSTCSAPTERSSPSPTPMWTSADVCRRTARPRRPPAGGGASRWSDASVHVPSINFNGMWWLFFFFFFHIVIISVIPRLVMVVSTLSAPIK